MPLNWDRRDGVDPEQWDGSRVEHSPGAPPVASVQRAHGTTNEDPWGGWSWWVYMKDGGGNWIEGDSTYVTDLDFADQPDAVRLWNGLTREQKTEMVEKMRKDAQREAEMAAGIDRPLPPTP